MRSDILLESKPRSNHGRHCLQRRRLAKSAAMVNGEYDPDLALAIQESLKQAELDRHKRQSQEKENLESSPENLKFSQSRKMAKVSLQDDSEMQRLKDLVSVHMDLIQQQQELMNKKDKTIRSLKQENSALQCRLQRMERRMALLKQKEGMSSDGHIVHSPPPQPGTLSYTEPISIPTPKLEKQSAPKRKWEPQSVSKKAIPNEPVPKPSTVKSADVSRTKKEHRKRKLTSRPDKPVKDEETSQTSDLLTNKHYYVSYYKPISDEIETESRPDILKGAQSQLEVECPSWRIKTYSNLYVIEGTEDHEDETFIRRHQKPEIEEKRRKRWDDQRVREEKIVEKLKDRENSIYKKKQHNPVESFYPRLEDIKHIEIQDRIPVTAFGHAVPYMKPGSFTLPWNPKPPNRRELRHK